MRGRLTYLRPVKVAYCRAYGPYANSAAEAWRNMTTLLDQTQIRTEVVRGYGLAHDNPQKSIPERLRYDAAVQLSENVTSEQTKAMAFTTFPGGVYIVGRHCGDHEQIRTVIRTLRDDCISGLGLSLDTDRPLVEIYVDDPLFCPVEKLRTDICLPVSVSKSINADNSVRASRAHLNQDEQHSI